MRNALISHLKAALLLLLFFVAPACDTRANTYDSIWAEVYGNDPAYQDELEMLEVE